MQRRIFIKRSALLSAGLGSAAFGLAERGCSSPSSQSDTEADSTQVAVGSSSTPLFKISLAEWSFHKALFNPDLFKLPWTEIGDKLQNDYDFVTRQQSDESPGFSGESRHDGLSGSRVRQHLLLR